MYATLRTRSGRAISRFCASLKDVSQQYDVVINGGGIVGAIFAADLLQRTQGNIRLCIIDAGAAKPILTSQPDARVYALSPRSIQLLKQLGAWDKIEARSQPYSTMQVWESSGPGLVKFRASDAGKEELGRICEDVTVQQAIYSVLELHKSIDIVNQASLIEIKQVKNIGTGGFGNLELVVKFRGNGEESERKMRTRLLVGADGANSLVRRLVGIPSWGWSYGQEAVVATVSLVDRGQATDKSPSIANSTAWQRYLPTGPIALLPCWEGYSSIVWSVPVKEARRLKALSTADFLSEVNSAFRSPSTARSSDSFDSPSSSGARPRGMFPPFIDSVLNKVETLGMESLHNINKELGAASLAMLSMAQLRDPYSPPPLVHEISSPRLSFPLQFQQAKYYAVEHCALIGDAAHSIHPQAGQGLNLGIADAASLSKHLVAALEGGMEISDKTTLSSFATERYTKNLAMMGAVDLINTVFKDSLGVIDQASQISPDPNSRLLHAKRLIRSMGMLGIHNMSMLKGQIAKFAMGLE